MKNKLKVCCVNEGMTCSSFKCDMFSKRAAMKQPFRQKFKCRFIVCGGVNKGCA